MHLGLYLDALVRSERRLQQAFLQVAESHADDADVHHLGKRLAEQCGRHADGLQPFATRHREDAADVTRQLTGAVFDGPRTGALGLLRDLHDLYLMACECDVTWTVVGQAARSLRDTELEDLVAACEPDTAIQVQWLMTRIKQAAPQTLVVS